MAPAIGTVALIGGAIVVAGVAYLVYKNKNNDNSGKRNSLTKKLLDDDDRYDTYKATIEDYVKEKNWQNLEALLSSGVRRFPDLIKMIEEALNNKR